MHYKKIFLSGASLLAMTAHASADPIFTPLTFLLFSAAPVWIAPGAIYAGLQLAAVGALAAVQSALAPSRPRVDPQDIKNTRTGTEGPGRYATGRVRLAGRIGFGNTTGYDIYRLIFHCFGPIDAIEEYYYDGRSITVESDGTVSSPPWAKPNGSNMFVQSKMGTGGETVWPQLKAGFPALVDDDFRNRGIGQTLLHVRNPGTASERFQTLLQGGIKELEVQARVGKFFDPRDGQTRWTLNGVLQCLHWYRLLPDMRDDLIDFNSIAALADDADQMVPTLTGTAPRCTISGGWEGNLTTDVVLDMLESAGLEWRRPPAKLHTFKFTEDDPVSELTLLDRHIIDREFAPEEAAKRPNVCRVSYYSHERQGDLAEIDLTNASWARVQSDISKYGEKEKHYKLPFCDNASQAQRIARRLFWMDRAQKGLVRTTFAGRAAWGLRTITVEVPDVGEGGESAFVKCRVVAPMRMLDSEGVCEIPVAIIPDELKVPWNPAVDEMPAPPVLPELQYETDIPTPAPPNQATVVQYPNGTWETRIRFTGGDAGTAEANYRYYPDENPTQWAAMTEYQAGSTYYAYVGTNTNGLKAEFRVRLVDGDDVGYFSDPLIVDPMSVSNTATGAPSVTTSEEIGDPIVVATWDITVPELRAVKVVVEEETGFGGSEWTVIATLDDIRPGITRQVHKDYNRSGGGSTVNWRVASYTSNGTRGAYATGSFNIPGN
ncbi:hypothetical protein [Chelativorans multitrophicus]|jgi:hypothetical protein|uniref:Tip attachment protein J domain-containing protein n=1 Tax=Chelativorans sp. (strain BNC1) TaxID=266779 RepID=Q11IZ4_CHESB|nr:hypothetical protein [Chelativorans multitrophicus]